MSLIPHTPCDFRRGGEGTQLVTCRTIVTSSTTVSGDAEGVWEVTAPVERARWGGGGFRCSGHRQGNPESASETEERQWGKACGSLMELHSTGDASTAAGLSYTHRGKRSGYVLDLRQGTGVGAGKA